LAILVFRTVAFGAAPDQQNPLPPDHGQPAKLSDGTEAGARPPILFSPRRSRLWQLNPGRPARSAGSPSDGRQCNLRIVLF
jgi:hypothetical protein